MTPMMYGRRTRSMLSAIAALVIGIGMLATPAAAQAIPLEEEELLSPALTSAANGRIDVFFRSDGQLLHWYRTPDGVWSLSNLGGRIITQPAAASWESGRLDVFALGTDSRLWHRWYTGGEWRPWEPLGSRLLTSAPAVASWGPGRLDVFARGRENDLLHKWFDNGTWSVFQSLQGVLTSSPAAASWAPGRIDVFVRGTEQRLQHKWFVSGSDWSSWETLSGDLHTQPAVASPGQGQLDVFMRGAVRVNHKHFARGQGWSLWQSLGGNPISGPGAMATGETVRVAAQWPDENFYYRTRPSPTAAWSGWTVVGG